MQHMHCRGCGSSFDVWGLALKSLLGYYTQYALISLILFARQS